MQTDRLAAAAELTEPGFVSELQVRVYVLPQGLTKVCPLEPGHAGAFGVTEPAVVQTPVLAVEGPEAVPDAMAAVDDGPLTALGVETIPPTDVLGALTGDAVEEGATTRIA